MSTSPAAPDAVIGAYRSPRGARPADRRRPALAGSPWPTPCNHRFAIGTTKVSSTRRGARST